MKLLNSEIEREKKYLESVEDILHNEINSMQLDAQKKMEEITDDKRDLYARKQE